MPVSKKRKKTAYTPPRRAGRESDNPAWLVPAMVTALVGGVAWIIVYYVSQYRYPLDIGNTNIIIGFGLIIVGFFLTTRWK